ncbi:hypothetical protein [Corynebacterium sp.]|uniref:hypothetical protein n=1 Tax=Corynebacterium sp. TaxID=1720 RepID=UPI0026DD3EA3|nr:hypothetical protein [Corynebacterium sp.]MDO4610543.1 hypothetical protein [Corynebacterium sp.]
MDPLELNAGRFHLRPLRHDSRVDDVPALRLVHGGDADAGHVDRAAADWAADRVYRWAVAEQTHVDLVAEASVTPVDGPGGSAAIVEVLPAGDVDRIIPVDDPDVEPVTVGEACRAARDVVTRFAQEALERTVDSDG